MIRSRVRACLAIALSLVVLACGGSNPAGPRSGPPIVIASFDTVESSILAEIYARALRDAGYEVSRVPAIESRDFMYEALAAGEIDLVTDYLGVALSDGFEIASVPDADSIAAALSEAHRALNATVLDYAPAENKLVFVVTPAFAAEHGLESIADLAAVSDATLGGMPECEELETCFAGLVRTYELGNLEFEPFDDPDAILPALVRGEIQIAQVPSTRPVIAERGLVPLTDELLVIPAENVVPIVRDEIIDEHGSEFTELINTISAQLTTEVLLALNANVEAGAASPQTMARRWLEANF